MSTFQFLLLEDKLQDTEAIQAVLTDGGIDCELLRVDTRADFVRALETTEFDLFLAAYAMPGFDGMAALETARNLRPETPLIFVSASLGEELAIEALKRGATDYVLKQRLKRLVPCVQRALREAQERRGRQRAEAVLRQTSVELERQLQKFNATLSTITDFVFNFDRDGRFIYANQVLLDLWGLTAEEAIGKTMAQLNYPQAVERQLTENMQRVFETGKTVKAETFYTNPAGVDGYFEYILSPAFAANGTVEFVAGSSRNISERKAAEVEREQLLQQEQSARAVAEQANRLKDEFLAVLSHELRSPLNPILGWVRLLQSSKFDAARQAEALGIIERNAKLQAQLLEDLLDISRIRHGKLSLTAAPVNLELVILAALETVQLAAQAKHIEFLLDLDRASSSVLGDASRLQQAVWNLLTNAVKFTPTGGQVIVKLQQVDGLAQIRVSDTGKGINSQFLPHVFEYFRQEDGSTTRKFGGLGLGLAIARQIVELHGGTIAVESAGVE